MNIGFFFRKLLSLPPIVGDKVVVPSRDYIGASVVGEVVEIDNIRHSLRVVSIKGVVVSESGRHIASVACYPHLIPTVGDIFNIFGSLNKLKYQ